MKLHLPVDVDWKVAAGTGPDSGELEGYAAVYGVVGEDGEVVSPGAFTKTAHDWSTAKQPLPLIADHELSSAGVVGSIVGLRDDRVGLWFKAKFGRTQKAQDLRANVLDGHMRGTSWTAEIKRARPGNGAVLKGREVRRFLDELRLFEITLSPFPIFPEAGVRTAKAATAVAWDASPDRFGPDEWRNSCLLDTGSGDRESKDRYRLPVREPDGSLNINAMGEAATALEGARGGVTATDEERRGAARRLVRLYAEADAEAPESLRQVAGMMSSAQSRWATSMQAALSIDDEFARKAAIDVLVGTYPVSDIHDLVAAAGDAPGTTPDAAGNGTPGTEDPHGYALRFLSKSGPPDGAPSGDQPPAIPAPLKVLEHDRSVAEIEALERELGIN